MTLSRMLVAIALASLTACSHPHRVSLIDPPRQFAGVDVVRMQSGGFSVRLHSAAVSGGEPLYVIDDAPALIDSRLGINWLEPEDIERIEVVKNPADLAVYGPRAVNGVVLITTKRGMRARAR
jgi:TonB-dependent starch-binding outer membrane protein SusC